jgi:Uncharacterized protein conserved in bacteria (DUF2188)
MAVRTVHRGGEWINEIEGHGLAGRGFWTKDEAQKAGRALAERLRVKHEVYDQYGNRTPQHFGNDPRDVCDSLPSANSRAPRRRHALARAVHPDARRLLLLDLAMH